MIRPIKTEIRRRRILTYDLEWFPGTLELRLIGVFDGSEYRSYTDPYEFLQGELTAANAGSWFFAHAGGLADFQFLLQTLVDRGYQVKAAFSGSSAIIVEISDGNKKWLLIDSFWLLRSPLKGIGEAVGIPKLKDYLCPGTSMIHDAISGKMVSDHRGCDHPPPEDPADPWCVFYSPMGQLKTYNEQDNRILWTAIVQLQDSLNDMGSELCMTQASSAMRLYRRVYLDRDIRTSDSVNERARVSYVGSRVEVYANRCQEGFYYDINSSFPFAMTFPAPGSLRGGRTTLPTGESEMFLADVEIEVPDMYLPPIPWRHPKEMRVYFPTGRWRTWLWGIDIRLLESVGGRILKCHRSMEFDRHDTLNAYAVDLYNRRLAATTAFEKMLYKLLLNSLYGKFGESPLKQAAYFNPEDPRGMAMVMPGVFLAEETQDIEHEHVPISTHITAFARRTLYKFNKLCLDLGGQIFYNDSVAADRCVVVRDPDQHVHVVPVERLWKWHAEQASERFDGKEEGFLPGWHALSKSLETGKEDFFPIASIIRHKAGKTMHLVSTKEGQTEVTCDHGIMTEGPEGLEETTPEDFVRDNRAFVRVKPPAVAQNDVVDLYREVSSFKLTTPEGRSSRFEASDLAIYRDGFTASPGEPSIRRLYRAGSPELHALLRVVGSFVSEGSSSLAGTLTPVTAQGFEPVVATRNMFSIAQKDESWSKVVQKDLKMVIPKLHTAIYASQGASVLRSDAVLPAFFFAALCGEGHSRNRRLPTFCMNLSREDFLVLWKKLVEGDGNVHPQGYETYTTISRELASQLSYLLSLHGFDHAITYRPEKKSWFLRIREGQPRVGSVIRHEAREARPDEFVYDLSVAGGGTFVDAMGCVLLKNTDSCVTTVSPKQFDPNHDWIPGHKGIIGKKLGQMKLEYYVNNGQFVAPKIYMLDGVDAELHADMLEGKLKEKDAKKFATVGSDIYNSLITKGVGVDDKLARELAQKDVVRAKGFSRMTMAKFHDLVEGREITVRRMSRVRELLRDGVLIPRESEIKKRMQIKKTDDGHMEFKMRSKRKMLPAENNSRPWNINKELFTEGDLMASTVK